MPTSPPAAAKAPGAEEVNYHPEHIPPETLKGARPNDTADTPANVDAESPPDPMAEAKPAATLQQAKQLDQPVPSNKTKTKWILVAMVSAFLIVVGVGIGVGLGVKKNEVTVIDATKSPTLAPSLSTIPPSNVPSAAPTGSCA